MKSESRYSEHVFQCGSYVRTMALWLKLYQLAYYPQNVHAPFCRRNEKLHLVRKEHKPYFVVVPHGRKGECGAYLGNDVALCHIAGAEIFGTGDIDGEHHCQLPLLLEYFDVRLAGLCRYVPVDIAHVVAELVCAHLAESHAAPFERAVVLARKDVV